MGSDKTAISEDIKCHFLLRFSGLSNFQRSQVIASCGNKFELAPMEAAMRTQFPSAHASEDRGGRDRPDHRQDRGRDKGKDSGKGRHRYKYRQYGAWAAEAVDDDPYDDERHYDDAFFEYDETMNEEDLSECGSQDLPPQGADQEEIEAYAAFHQAKSYMDEKRGKGKGKGKK